MKKFLAILAVVAAFAFVGCDKEKNNSFVLEGQWLIPDIEGVEVKSQMGYDIGATRPGEIIVITHIVESNNPKLSVGSYYELMSTTYTKNIDTDGNVTGFTIKMLGEEGDEPQYSTATIQEIVDNNSIVLKLEDQVLTFNRIATKPLLAYPNAEK